ncbi:MAG: gfo/Idh/MocA family oxidoreductase [Planctomycetes bacterium]|nr:gfo/Idh/MocA family oxidoreductase [Planctomycetota bacterium]
MIVASKTLNVGMIGYNFMGKAHTQAWRNAPLYFDLDAAPVTKVICGRSREPLETFADRWGWQETSTDWRQVVERDDIDIIDVSTPTATHCQIAIAAAQAGKHVFCEKPFALSSDEARRMYEAAKAAGVVHYVNHNYRRCPAVMLAKKMIDDGRIGRIFHWRGAYLQSWIVDPDFPLTWQLQKEHAGAGPHYDLNSHSVDLARFLVGDITRVSAMTSHFIRQRPLPPKGATAFAEGVKGGPKGEVTVDDAAFMTVQFANGALGSFESSRFALGRKNFNTFEIYGSEGAVAFNLERMNELQYFDRKDSADAHGFRTIIATEPVHAYMKQWWPPGHMIGYEHEFTHAVVDFVHAITRGGGIKPDFEDGWRCMQVLEAGLASAASGEHVDVGAGT